MYNPVLLFVLITALESDDCIVVYDPRKEKGKSAVEIGARVEVSQLVDGQGE